MDIDTLVAGIWILFALLLGLVVKVVSQLLGREVSWLGYLGFLLSSLGAIGVVYSGYLYTSIGAVVQSRLFVSGREVSDAYGGVYQMGLTSVATAGAGLGLLVLSRRLYRSAPMEDADSNLAEES